MDNKDRFRDNRGAGFEQIPDPDNSKLGREGFSGKAEDVVGGIMDNVQKALTGDTDSDLSTDRTITNDQKK